jgi:hypothetical protein
MTTRHSPVIPEPKLQRVVCLIVIATEGGAGGGRLVTGICADDAGEEGASRRTADLVDAAEARHYVVDRHWPPVRKPNAAAEREDIGLATILGLGQRCREIGDDRQPGIAVRLLESQQPVIADLHDLKELERVVDLRVDRPRGGLRAHPKRAATVVACGRGDVTAHKGYNDK